MIEIFWAENIVNEHYYKFVEVKRSTKKGSHYSNEKSYTDSLLNLLLWLLLLFFVAVIATL